MRWTAGLVLCSVAAAQVDYSLAGRAVEGVAAAEIEAHGVPGLSFAVLIGDELVWSGGVGVADAVEKTVATGDTVYRMASISKVFTASAVMREVATGGVSLDAPVRELLPSFAPRNRWREPITLRHLLSHHAGIVREPMVGNYFEEGHDLEAVVASLRGTEVRFEPGTRFAYSNAGPSVAGLLLARRAGMPWESTIDRLVIEPLGLESTTFDAASEIAARCARGEMWTVDGRRFKAPTWPLGMAPAGSVYSTCEDLVRFARGHFLAPTGGPALHSAATLRAMFTPPFDRPDAGGAALGCFVDQFDGALRVGHGGAIYGHASQLWFLPEEGVAVAVANNLDCANGVSRRVATAALTAFRAARDSAQVPAQAAARPQPVGVARAREIAGRYGDAWRWIEFEERDGDLWAVPNDGGPTVYRALGDRLVEDGRQGPVAWERTSLVVRKDGVERNGRFWPRLPAVEPPACPPRLREYVGEYGPDHNVLYILEDGGRLHCLVEWFARYPLVEQQRDRFAMPDHGMYPSAPVEFSRGPDGGVAAVSLEGIRFERRPVGTASGVTFKIKPRFSPERLRAMAAEARRPKEKGPFRDPDLVELTALDPTIKLDIRYASDNNFMDMTFYPRPVAMMQRPAAEAVVRVHKALAADGYGLLIHDAYRPWSVTKMFWDATPEGMKDFVANPTRGSRHNRGCAVDLTLFDRSSGDVLETVSGYDEFTPRAYPHYPGGTSRQRHFRRVLRRAMEAADFTVYEWEWWHFDFSAWREYPILDESFGPK